MDFISKNKSALFIIESPFQLILANEAINYFQINVFKIVILQGKGKTSKKQLIATLKTLKLDLKNVYFYNLPKSIVGLLINTRIKQLRDFNFSTVFLSDFYSFNQKVFLHRFLKQRKRILYIDDGSASLILFNNRNLKNKYIKKISFKNKIKLFYFNTFLGLNRNNVINRITFFSIYSTETAMSIPIIKNRLTYLKKFITDYKINKKLIFILGSDFTNNEIQLSNYNNIIKTIISNSEATEIHYYPHRGELNNIPKTIQNNKIKIINTFLPIELAMVRLLSIPIEIYGFGSTALFTLKLLYPEIIIHNINISCFFKDKYLKEMYSIVENFYAEKNINLYKPEI